jgi:hypothetical protein
VEPFIFSHFFAVSIFMPLPLHEFLPLQALLAPLQEPLPLQEFTPQQGTLLEEAALLRVDAIGAVTNATAAAVARTLASFFIWSVL